MEEQNAQQHDAVWTTDDHLLVSSVVVSLGAQATIEDKIIAYDQPIQEFTLTTK